jgi:hypothetical protein
MNLQVDTSVTEEYTVCNIRAEAGPLVKFVKLKVKTYEENYEYKCNDYTSNKTQIHVS